MSNSSVANEPQAGASGSVARFFVKYPQIGWTLFFLTLLLGLCAYQRLPKRKDPFLPPRIAVATCAWPGASAVEMEESVTRRLEESIGSSQAVDHLDSSSRTNGASVTVTLREDLSERDVAQAFDAIDLRLRALSTLPKGTGPVTDLLLASWKSHWSSRCISFDHTFHSATVKLFQCRKDKAEFQIFRTVQGSQM